MEDQCIRCPQLATVLNIVEEKPSRLGAIKKWEGGERGTYSKISFHPQTESTSGASWQEECSITISLSS